MSALPTTAPSIPRQDPAADWPDLTRREMLARSDHLLDQVEQLRLAEQRRVPPSLRSAIRTLQQRTGRPESTSPRTVRAAQLLVFTVQQRLMAANPRHSHPHSHLGRALGTPKVTRLSNGGAWKFLTLPPRAAFPAEGEWRQQVELTVERAFDRWGLAQDQAVATARAGAGAIPALRRAQAAWTNYWELSREADHLLRTTPVSSSRNSAAVIGSAEAAILVASASRNSASRSSSSAVAAAMARPASAASPGASSRSS